MCISERENCNIFAELEECSTLKTGSDETVVAGFEEGDTIAGIIMLASLLFFSNVIGYLSLEK